MVMGWQAEAERSQKGCVCACNYACMPVGEHVHGSLAQHMSRPTTKCSKGSEPYWAGICCPLVEEASRSC